MIITDIQVRANEMLRTALDKNCLRISFKLRALLLIRIQIFR